MLLLVVWSSATVASGVLSAMTGGVWKMPRLCVVSLDIYPWVRCGVHVPLHFICELIFL